MGSFGAADHRLAADRRTGRRWQRSCTAIGTATGQKVGAPAHVLQDLVWRRVRASVWKRGISQEERMTQRTKLARLWWHDEEDDEGPGEGAGDDYHG